MFDYGTFLGGILIGILGDKCKKRAAFMFPSLLLAAAIMVMIRYVLGTDPIHYYFFVFAMESFKGDLIILFLEL